MNLWKREECKNTDPSLDLCEKYTSTFQTAGIPCIIGLCLFFLLTIILFVIVRKRRRQQHAAEEAKHREIDDGVELTRQYHMKNEQQGLGIMDTFQEPPPKYQAAV
ncbi:hypothetical protein A1O1_02142 [Capronia coronata CBS 617.96]|uniref:Uncharacterized protein n=1 Tax=Capronia coronata CBS 617.96 TaxID=1182541 RepID=W9ZGV9_9EURO|nr:uncharacterized protein A1O1_02142 [Capronia coronata CBS 617.96]EXJ93749.1 hypothetical protein A1O1_02142 [Capronia coronata CBS 617.96]